MNSYLPIEGTSHRVHVQIDKGNITDGTAQAVVVFRSFDGTATGDSLRILQEAGGDVEAEYKMVKAQHAQGGRHVSKGVVLTEAGNLQNPRHIFHLHVDQDIPPWKLSDTLITGLRLADNKGLQSIAFPPLSVALQYDKPIGTMVNRFLESFTDFVNRDRPICLHFIQVVMSVAADSTTQSTDAAYEAQRQVDRYKELARDNDELMKEAMKRPSCCEQRE